MHYFDPELTADWAQELEPVENFLRALGASAPEPQSTLRVAKSSLPEETEVVLFTPAQ